MRHFHKRYLRKLLTTAATTVLASSAFAQVDAAGDTTSNSVPLVLVAAADAPGPNSTQVQIAAADNVVSSPAVEQASVFARNLFDKNYVTALTIQTGNSGLILGQAGDPRLVGAMLRVRY